MQSTNILLRNEYETDDKFAVETPAYSTGTICGTPCGSAPLGNGTIRSATHRVPVALCGPELRRKNMRFRGPSRRSHLAENGWGTVINSERNSCKTLLSQQGFA